MTVLGSRRKQTTKHAKRNKNTTHKNTRTSLHTYTTQHVLCTTPFPSVYMRVCVCACEYVFMPTLKSVVHARDQGLLGNCISKLKYLSVLFLFELPRSCQAIFYWFIIANYLKVVLAEIYFFFFFVTTSFVPLNLSALVRWCSALVRWCAGARRCCRRCSPCSGPSSAGAGTFDGHTSC